MTTARRLAVDALVRIDRDGAYANLLVPGMLDASGLSPRDRAFVTELVYGTVRMRRACDWLIDPFIDRPLDADVRNALRLGAYQLVFLRTPAHAAVSATVDAAPRRARGLVNAVLRKVARGGEVTWPDDGTRLSYPDWVVARVRSDIGEHDGTAALAAMNRPAPVHQRPDGYTQDQASQWVAELVGAEPGERVADTCAGPGGKATWMAHGGATIVAIDVNPTRAGLVAANATRTGVADRVQVAVADGRRPPFPPGSVDRVLVDAPCSGLGVLRRRPDARWRIGADDVDVLASLQRELVAAGADLIPPGGVLVYSVCTLTAVETTGVDEWLATARSDLDALPPPGAPWRAWGRGALLLPQAADTDGMFALVLRRNGRSR